ncbi:MAG: thioredoxin domain-containing protein [Nitrospinae bacterium]|nr:thioredoxin domain-containing protein [Nitrospinota bacterium]
MHRRKSLTMSMPGTALLLLLLSLPIGALPAAASEPLAEVDGEAITAEAVEGALGAQLTKLYEQIYALKRQKVETLIGERLLGKEAGKRGISVQALLDTEVTSKVGLVTEQEVEAFYQANKAQLKGDEASLRERIRTHLQNQRLATQRQAFVQALRAQSTVVVHLTPPPVVRTEVSVDGAPFRGLQGAPVTIVEFSDFHCPFCKQVLPTLTQLQSQYGDKVKLVFRDFPIDQLHPGARKGHEAARCANEQGKFWAYHDLLFANAPKASPEQLKGYAQEAGMNVAAFEQCVASGKYREAVQQDIEEGSRAGVTGTPAFFINGRLVSGAQPLENFSRIIEEELMRVR